MVKRIVIPLFVVIILLGGAVLWIVGGILISPSRTDMPPTPEGARAVSFRSESGSEVYGWYYSTPEAIGSAVLMHGVRGNRTDLVGRVSLFRDLGFSVLIFDFQAHGESDGEAITFGARESLDAIAAVEYVREEQPAAPVLALGVSLGGAAALLAENSLGADILILESVYSTIDQAVKNRLNMRLPLGGALSPLLVSQLQLRAGIAPAELSPLAAAENVNIPVLVMSGSDDLHTLGWETEAIYNAIPAVKSLYFFAGAAHQNLQRFDPLAYQSVVSEFVCANMRTRSCRR